MPFFENARQFEINGGNFIDVKGNQNNYHYDQSLKVSGQNNSAVYSHGSYHRGGDNHEHITNKAEQMTVIGQGSHANVSLGPNSIPMNYLPQQPHYGPRFDQSYAHLQANAQAMAQPFGYAPQVPPNGLFHHNSTGHVNQSFHPTGPQQQPLQHSPPQSAYNQHQVPGSQPVYSQQQHSPPQPVYNPQPPSPPQPVYNHQPPAPTPHYPAPPHSPASINSAPPALNVPAIHITQSTHERNPSYPSATLSPTVAPLTATPSPPPVEHQATAHHNTFLGPAPMPSPSPSSSTGSISSTTLAQSLQPAALPPIHSSTTPAPTSVPAAVHSAPPTPASVPATAPPAIQASASSSSAPAAPGQSVSGTTPAFSEFPELKPLPGATFSSQDGEKKKKKKKRNIFSRWFKKVPKEAVATNA